MTIHLPSELETSLRAEVKFGHYPSIEVALAEAVRMLLSRGHTVPSLPAAGSSEDATGPGLIGALREDVEILDRAVEDAMKVREERPWRLPAGE